MDKPLGERWLGPSSPFPELPGRRTHQEGHSILREDPNWDPQTETPGGNRICLR